MIDWRPDCTKQSWGTDAGAFTGGPTKIVLHSTETIGFPSYNSGQSAPHETWKWDRAINRFEKRQHIPHTLAARALINLDGGVQTNRDGAHQVEIVGYSDQKLCDTVGGFYLPGASDVVLKELGREIRKLAADIGCTLRLATPWVHFPDSYGWTAAQRFTGIYWDGFSGVCGHEHVPENDHGDPGDLPVSRALDLSTPTTPQSPPPVTTVWSRSDVVAFQRMLETTADGMWGSNTDARALAVRAVANDAVAQTDNQERLTQAIVDVTVDGIVGPNTRAALRTWVAGAQHLFHVTADGIWGPNTDAHFLAFRKEWFGQF